LTPIGPLTWGRLAQECGAGGTVTAFAEEDCGCSGSWEMGQALDMPDMGSMTPSQMLVFMLLQKALKR